jgi:hypothetical protein
MYKIGLKHNGILISSKELSCEETKNLHEDNLSSILMLFNIVYKLDISDYRLNEYESIIGGFFIHIRTEDLEKIRDNKLTELGI